MNGKKQNYERLWYLSIFAFCYLWFAHIHPLVVFDADDWTYISYARNALPSWGGWNPSRVFPEIFMPLVSTAAVYLLRPFGVSYLTALTTGSALVVSGCITLYVFCFARLVKRLFSLGKLETGYVSALFFLLHFLVFRISVTENTYLFDSPNVTCYYYYMIPDLLCGSAVMCMAENPVFDAFLEKGSAAKKGLLLLAVYLLIFSNLPASGILAVYAGAKALLSLLGQRKTFRLKEYLRENRVYIAILLIWAVSAVFELFGGRAGSLNDPDSSLLSNFKTTLDCFVFIMRFGCNRLFWMICAGLLAGAAVLLLLTKKKENVDRTFLTQVLLWMVCTGVMLLYILLLFTVAGYAYVTRSDCLFGVLFFGLLLVMVCFSYLVSKKPKLLTLVPLALCVILFEINTSGNTFQDATIYHVDSAICAQISNDLVEQAVAAEAAGLSEMDLYVPHWNNEGNWPHDVGLMDRMPRALVEHGILRKPITMNVVISEEMNEKYGLPVPEAAQ